MPSSMLSPAFSRVDRLSPPPPAAAAAAAGAAAVVGAGVLGGGGLNRGGGGFDRSDISLFPAALPAPLTAGFSACLAVDRLMAAAPAAAVALARLC